MVVERAEERVVDKDLKLVDSKVAWLDLTRVEHLVDGMAETRAYHKE